MCRSPARHRDCWPLPETLPITQHPGLDDSLGKRDPAKAFLYRELGGATPAGVRERLPQVKYELADVSKLRMPVLLIVGERDAGFPPRPSVRSARQSRTHRWR